MLHEELTQILKQLEFTEDTANTEMKEFFSKVLSACQNTLDSDNIVNLIQKSLKDVDTDAHNEKKPYYYIFLAYASHTTENNKSIYFADSAAGLFNSQGNNLNQAIAIWFLGSLCRQSQPQRASEKIDYAIKIVKKLEDNDKHFGLYNKQKFDDIVAMMRQSLAKTKAILTNQERINESTYTTENSRSGESAILQSFPIYNSIRAGEPQSSISPSDTFLEIESFNINDQPYCLKNLHGSGRVVYKDPNKLYVLKVIGYSMNNTKPETINDGDYVLVYKTNAPERGDIVVTEFYDGIDLKTTLKRLKSRGNTFYLSPESTDSSHQEIPLDNESTISGVVVGVFKPCAHQPGTDSKSIPPIDYPEPSAQSFEEINKQNLDLLGTTVIVNRPGLSDQKIINDILIPAAFKENASLIFALTPSGDKYKKYLTLHDNDLTTFLPRQVYKIESGTQKDNAMVIAHIRSWLRERSDDEKKIRIVVIFDTLQKWADELEIQIRHLIQEASSLNLSIWIHSPIFLIPNDLLPTIGNVVIIWPSKNEIKLLEENLPGLDVDLETKKQLQGLFIYNERFSNKWKVIEFTP